MKRFQWHVAFLIASFVVFNNATEVQQCQGSNLKKLDTSDISITNCNKDVCKLRKRTEVTVKIVFTPESDYSDLTTFVTGELYGLPLPFVGVDNTSSKNNVFTEDGETKAEWPLKSGTKYVYKRSFKILEIYPSVNVVVRWSLSSNQKDVVCFQVPAKIV